MSPNAYLEGPIVVFGASGFLGVAIIRELLRVARSERIASPRIIAIVRSSNPGPGLSLLSDYVEIKRIEFITEDSLNDLYYNTLRGDVKAFIHVAGLVRHSADDAEIAEMYASNVVLSNIIFSFAEKHTIRTIYSSVSGVVGCQFIEDKFRVAHDDAPLCHDTIKGIPFYEQKAAIEQYWRPRAADGRVPIVFMRPSLLLGPGDDRLSSSKVVLDFIQGRMTFLPKGGISFLDVRDAAAAFVTALSCDETAVGGTAINLTCANIPFHEFAAILEEVSGVQAPKVELPATLARVGGRLANSFNSLVGNPKDDGSDPIYVEIGQRFWNVTCQRALQLLEFDPRDPTITLRDAARYLRQTYGDATVRRNVSGNTTLSVNAPPIPLGSSAIVSTSSATGGSLLGVGAHSAEAKRKLVATSVSQGGAQLPNMGLLGGKKGNVAHYPQTNNRFVTPRRIILACVAVALLLSAFLVSVMPRELSNTFEQKSR